MTDDRPGVLVRGPNGPLSGVIAPLSPHYAVHCVTGAAEFRAALAAEGARLRAVITLGAARMGAAEMALAPGLRLIHALGVGHEGVDLAEAARRGIAVTNGAGTNSFAVADQAMALLLGLTRAVPLLERIARAGRRPDAGEFAVRSLSGKRMGIFGMGHIGQAVARRAEGFGMAIGHASRRPRPDLPWPAFADLARLALWADVLVIAVPGGPATRHAVDGGVLAALGPEGILVNVGRGEVVDTGALVAALTTGTLGGAALDVWEGEPAVSAALAGAPNLILSPHVGGVSPESMRAMTDLAVENLLALATGGALRNRLA